MEFKEDWVTPGEEEEGAEGMEMRVAETMPHAAGDAMWLLMEESLRRHVREF